MGSAVGIWGRPQPLAEEPVVAAAAGPDVLAAAKKSAHARSGHYMDADYDTAGVPLDRKGRCGGARGAGATRTAFPSAATK